MNFVVGQLVRRVGPSWGDVCTNRVYQIAEVELVVVGHQMIKLVGSEKNYKVQYFIPFQWQKGDEFIITKPGLGLSPEYVGVTGKVVTPGIYRKGYPEEAPYWTTDQPETMGTKEYPLCVLESQIAPKLGTGGYPEGEIVVPQQAVVVPEKKLRFINRTN